MNRPSLTESQLAAGLRAHLPNRAPEGLRERTTARVRTTRQVRRLPWIFGLGDAHPTIQRRAIVLVALLGLLAAMTIVGASLVGDGPSGRTVFEGTWTASPNASRQVLTIGSGTSPKVDLQMECNNPDAPAPFLAALGEGNVVDRPDRPFLVVLYRASRSCDPQAPLTSIRYAYEERTNTLTEVEGNQPGTIWVRPLAVAPMPTRPTPTPDSNCIEFETPGAYTAPVGSLSLTVNMPGTPAEPWIGGRDGFNVLRASCTDRRGTGWIDAGVVRRIDSSACTGATILIETAAEAIAAVSAAKGINVVEQTNITLDGYTGTRFVINVLEDPNACPDGQIPLVDGVNPLDAGINLRLYLIDIDGTPLALGLFGYADWDPVVRRGVDGIIASMQIEP